MPKEQVNKEPLAPRPQTLSPVKTPNVQNNVDNKHNLSNNGEILNGEAVTKEPSSPPKIKLERTKSILKQSSKERGENPDLHSPKREQITFAPEVTLEKHLQEKESVRKLEKRVSLEEQKTPSKPNSPEKLKPAPPPPAPVVKKPEESSESSETTSSESEEDAEESKPKPPNIDPKQAKEPLRKLSLSLSASSSRINFEPVEALNAQKNIPKPVDKLKKNVVESSKSDTSSSTRDNVRNNGEKKANNVQCVKNSVKGQDQR